MELRLIPDCMTSVVAPIADDHIAVLYYCSRGAIS